MPRNHSSLLGEVLDVWAQNGWDSSDLHRFRMMADDGDGGSDTDDGGSDSPDGVGGGADGVDELGDAGKRALDAERERARTATKQLKPWKSIGDEFGLTPEQVRDLIGQATASEDGDDAPDVDSIRREAGREAMAKANARIIRAEVKALAADLFADPADAPLYLNLSDYDVSDDGDVDADEILADLKTLLQQKPHLAKAKSGGPRPDPSQGPRGDDKPDPGPGVNRLRQAYADSSK